ncbi:MAG: TnsA endonuclease N-terminal domain-containing protein [Janthinobacterium lividum]
MTRLQELIGLVPATSSRTIMPGQRGNRGRMLLLDQDVPHESDLERDFLLTLRFEPTLAAVRAQPFAIPCVSADGRTTRYTPDFLVVMAGPPARGMLVEIKYVADLKADWRNLKPRLRAGRSRAHDLGLDFLLLTERQIRDAQLENYRFLDRFRLIARDEAVEEHLVHRLASVGPSSPRRLLAATFETEQWQHHAKPFMWKLVATGRIMASMDEGPLDMEKTILWIDGCSNWRPYDPYSRKHQMRARKP